MKTKAKDALMMLGRLTLIFWLTLAAIAVPLLGPTTTAAQSGDGPLELQAMILTPTDLGFAGMARYPIDQVDGMMQTAQATAQEFVDYDAAPAERAQMVFVDSGLLRRYQHLYLLKYPNDPVPAVYTARRILTSVFEFTDASTAAAAFAPMAELLGRDAPAISAATSVGDESRLIHGAAPELNVNDEISLTFRIGRLIAYVAMRDDVGHPEQDEVETLAATLLDRIRMVEISGGPDLSRYVLRFPDEIVMTGPFEGYNLLAGNVVVRNAGYKDVYLPLLATAAAGAGALEGYDLSNALVMDGGGWAGDHGSTVYRFPDAVAAAAWLHALPSRLATTTARDLRVSAAPGIGDEAFVATYRSAPTDIIQDHRIDAVRVGPLVAILIGTQVAAETARQLLTAQASCLAAGGCAGPIAVPVGVIGSTPDDAEVSQASHD
jgi:hypothetical protein